MIIIIICISKKKLKLILCVMSFKSEIGSVQLTRRKSGWHSKDKGLERSRVSCWRANKHVLFHVISINFISFNLVVEPRTLRTSETNQDTSREKTAKEVSVQMWDESIKDLYQAINSRSQEVGTETQFM